MGNNAFFRKAQSGELGYKDIFADVFKKHTEKQTAKMFIAGTPLTTPSEDQMLADWTKPYAFLRFFGFGAIAALLLYLTWYATGSPIVFYSILIVIPALMPLTMLILTWELHIPRNIAMYEVLLMVLLGGIMSIIITFLLSEFITLDEAIFAPLTEEPAKILAVYLILSRKDRNRPYILNGVLIGFAVGTGFAVVESIGYSFNFFLGGGASYGIHVALVRMFSGIVGHGIYASLYSGALAMVKGRGRLKPAYLVNPEVLKYFGISCLIHMLNNWDFGLPWIADVISVQYFLIVMPLGLFAWLPMVRRGVNQIVQISAELNGGLTRAIDGNYVQGRSQAGYREAWVSPKMKSDASANTVWYLEGIAGEYANNRIDLEEGMRLRVGRNGQKCNIVLPQSHRVSNQHCELRFRSGTLTVRDLNSTNGTFLNSRRIAPQREVTVPEGSIVYMGDATCGFRFMSEKKRIPYVS